LYNKSRRAEELEKSGFDTYDAIHLASAEQAGVDVFLTTDEQIMKVANRNKKLLPFLVENPVKWRRTQRRNGLLLQPSRR